jgi:hypothetical protein
MLMLNLLLALVVQAAAPGQRVVVGLEHGQELLLQDPEFTGFIEGRNGDAVLMYRQADFHGEIPLRTIARIELAFISAVNLSR